MTREVIIQKMVQLLNISEEAYHNRLYKSGVEYAMHHTNGDEIGTGWLIKTKSYWTWYTNQWYIVDKAFVEEFKGSRSSYNLLRTWEVAHEPSKTKGIIGKDVIEESFMIMTSELNKEVIKNKL